MLLHVKVINGQDYQLEVSPEQTILSLKSQIAEQYQIPVNQQRLMFKGKPLTETCTLGSYSIDDGAKIYLSMKKEAELPKDIGNYQKELKLFAEKYFSDSDQFVAVFKNEMRNMANEMSLDDIERYAEVNLK